MKQLKNLTKQSRGGGQLSDLEHFIAYDAQADKIHVKPKPNYFIFYQEFKFGNSSVIIKKENGDTDKEISFGRDSETIKIDGYEAIYGFRPGIVFMDVVGFDGSNYDTSNIKDMSLMFLKAYNLKNTNFSNFNTTNVIDMSDMFNSCRSLVELDLSSFDTSNVTDIDNMFYKCSGLTSLDLSNFDTTNVKAKTSMFDGCSKLSKIKCKQAFKDWCITNKYNIGLPDTMVNGSVGAVGSGSNWEIVDYQG